MLILTRKFNELIIINNEIRITYLGQNIHNQCRLGIEAPEEISVHRHEIQERINLGIPMLPKKKNN